MYVKDAPFLSIVLRTKSMETFFTSLISSKIETQGKPEFDNVQGAEPGSWGLWGAFGKVPPPPGNDSSPGEE